MCEVCVRCDRPVPGPRRVYVRERFPGVTMSRVRIRE